MVYNIVQYIWMLYADALCLIITGRARLPFVSRL